MFSGHIIHPMFSTLIAITSNISGNTLIRFTPTKGSPDVNIHNVPCHLLLCGINGDQDRVKVTKTKAPVVPHFVFAVLFASPKGPAARATLTFPSPTEGRWQ